jgi:hypothetical protein
MERKQQRLFNAKGKAVFKSIQLSMIMYAIERPLPAMYRAVRKSCKKSSSKEVEIFGLRSGSGGHFAELFI